MWGEGNHPQPCGNIPGLTLEWDEEEKFKFILKLGSDQVEDREKANIEQKYYYYSV